ncbi:alcohol dehydrogenase [Metallosphaera sedula]|uniref:Alcohol dehydrogenase n=1 Tax=Metallosphaera prunae TaxID=47304 RepID=A0A4D8RXY1_METPR|nr:alcohol dehydrogenase catalytic domain-containing protein [Metallosphaera prunae]QCO29827.1 alcohol dehydrogenase [Metallosphaera prunae]
MRALVFEKRGIDFLEVRDFPSSPVRDDEVRLRVKLASINPVDLMAIESLPVSPLPHIPGSEFYGVVEEVGEKVTHVSVGDRVAVYTRLFDGTCSSCMRGDQTYCVNGKRVGVESQGGYAEEIVIPGRNVMKSDLSEEVLSSLPIAVLTPYHALRTVGVGVDDTVVVLGASGNTGIFAVQLAKRIGARVIAVTSREWVKEYADEVVDYPTAEEEVKRLTDGGMASVVVNSLGEKYWDLGLKLVGNHGKIVTYGGLTGGKVSLDVNKLYAKHASIVGTNRGNMAELLELLKLAKDLKVKVHRYYTLDEAREAFREFKHGNRDGRIFIRI